MLLPLAIKSSIIGKRYDMNLFHHSCFTIHSYGCCIYKCYRIQTT